MSTFIVLELCRMKSSAGRWHKAWFTAAVALLRRHLSFKFKRCQALKTCFDGRRFLETEVSFMIAEESCCSGEAHAFEQWRLPLTPLTTGIDGISPPL